MRNLTAGSSSCPAALDFETGFEPLRLNQPRGESSDVETVSQPSDVALQPVLAEAKELGFLGPGSISTHLAHSRAFLALMEQPVAESVAESVAGSVARSVGRAVDLGSGGGVPGLVLALAAPSSHWVLLDANERRTSFLERAVASLALDGRVEVRRQRAEDAGRDPALRGQTDVVVSRSFGGPAVTAECAAPLLRLGGALIVAEPPGGHPSRWPASGLALVGLRADVAVSTPWALQRMIQVAECPDRYPRRTGVPAKRPLFAGRDAEG